MTVCWQRCVLGYSRLENLNACEAVFCPGTVLKKAELGYICMFLFLPGYRVYYVDGNYPGSSRFVLDHQTYILNLTEVNDHLDSTSPPSAPDPNPKWNLLYQATKAYGLPSLLPSNWNSLIQTFVRDDQYFQMYWYLRHKGHVSKPCKETCKTAIICFLRSGRYDELQQCDAGLTRKEAASLMKPMC